MKEFFKKIYFKCYSLISITIWKQRLESWKLLYYKKTTVKEFSLNYFSGKRIAIIGPADSALQEKRGDYIDDFDIVVRVNKSIEIVDIYSKYIGKKTTVLFHGLDETLKTGCGEIETKKWRINGVQMVFYPLNEDRFLLNFNKYLFKNKNRVPISQINIELYNEIRTKINNFTPTTGFAALYILLQSKCSELYISGFTFFKTPHQNGYRKEINHNETMHLIKQYGNHNPDIEFDVFKKMVLTSELNINLDNKLQQLLYESK